MMKELTSEMVKAFIKENQEGINDLILDYGKMEFEDILYQIGPVQDFFGPFIDENDLVSEQADDVFHKELRDYVNSLRLVAV
jgi:hypothetical protein